MDLRKADVASVAAALVVAGCPVDIAADLAARARIETVSGERMLVLLGHGSAVDDEAGDASSWDAAVEQVTANVANENAEAHDRSGRGESGWSTYWSVPDRGDRRG